MGKLRAQLLDIAQGQADTLAQFAETFSGFAISDRHRRLQYHLAVFLRHALGKSRTRRMRRVYAALSFSTGRACKTIFSRSLSRCGIGRSWVKWTGIAHSEHRGKV